MRRCFQGATNDPAVTTLLIVAAILFEFPVACCAAWQSDEPANWPNWRGPQTSGLADTACSPPIRLSEEKNLKWKIPLDGVGHGTPVIWENRIYLQTAIPIDKQLPVPDVIPDGTPNITVNPGESVSSWKAQQFMVVCLDRTNGKTIWQRKVFEGMPHQGHHLKGGFASQSMVTNGRHFIAYFGSYGLYCFNADGDVVWQKDPQPQAMEAGLGEGSSPALAGKYLVVVVDQESQSFIIAYDVTTGDVLWKTNRDEPSNWSTPRIIEFNGKRQVVVNGIKVRAYELETGNLIWECGGHTASAIPVPAYGHGMIFNTSGWSRDKLQAIRLGKSGDLTDSKEVVWSLDKSTPYVPSPLLWGDELYLLDDRSFFSCYHAVNGRQHFKVRLPGRPNFSASPVGTDDRIYLCSEEGTVFVMQRGTEPVTLQVNRLDDSFYASPVVIGKEIYLRGQKYLYCFHE